MLEAAQIVGLLQKQSEPELFSAGQEIFQEGEPGDIVYGILEGKVDLVVNGKTVETIDTGEVFGVGVLVGVGYRTYTAIAKTDCKLAFLDRRQFLFAVQETPIFALKVMKSYSERLTRLERML